MLNAFAKKNIKFRLSGSTGFFNSYKIIRVLGVDYIHFKLKNGDDIYLANYGLPFIELLKPENFWTDEE